MTLSKLADVEFSIYPSKEGFVEKKSIFRQIQIFAALKELDFAQTE